MISIPSKQILLFEIFTKSNLAINFYADPILESYFWLALVPPLVVWIIICECVVACVFLDSRKDSGVSRFNTIIMVLIANVLSAFIVFSVLSLLANYPVRDEVLVNGTIFDDDQGLAWIRRILGYTMNYIMSILIEGTILGLTLRQREVSPYKISFECNTASYLGCVILVLPLGALWSRLFLLLRSLGLWIYSIPLMS